MRTGSAGSLWSRPRLEHLLDRARTHRLTAVTAPPGFGKTSILRRWAQDVPSAWHTLTDQDRDAPSLAARVTEVLRLQVPGLPRRLVGDAAAAGPTGRDDVVSRAESLAAQLSRLLDEHLGRSIVLVLDDVHTIDDAPGPVRFLEALVRQAPPTLHVVLATRSGLPFAAVRLRERGHLFELDASAVSLTLEDTRAWVVAQLGPDASRLAAPLHDLTAGWAATTRMAIEALRATPSDARAQRLSRLPTDQQFAALAGRVLDAEDAAVRELLRTVAPLPWFTTDLCVTLGLDDAPEVVDTLERRGLFIEEVTTEPHGFVLIELAREHIARTTPLHDDDRRHVLAAAAGHWRTRGRPDAALACLLDAGDPEALAAVLHESGERLTTTGHVDLVERAVASLPTTSVDAEMDRLAGMAAQASGEWDRAQARFEAAAAAAGDGPLDAGLAWRLGLIHHMRGDLGDALDVYARGVVDHPSRDTGLLLAWTATVHWLRGERDRCAALASRALEHATASDHPQALAAAHTVLAMLAALDGDRRANDAHYLRALDFAEAAGDVLQIVRIRVNRSSHHLEEGRWAAALAELEIAIGLAEPTGYGPFAAVAYANRAEVQLRRGRLEEAADDLAAAASIWRGMGSAMVGYPLNLLGDLDLMRGEVDRAIERHAEALEASRHHGDLQAQVPALAGLARAHLPDYPARARELAEEALAKNPSLAHVEALLAAGEAARACGDSATATRHALAAAEIAQERRDRVGLAEALRLQAALETPVAAAALLDEAIALWTEVGDPVGTARARLARAALLDPDGARAVAAEVRQRMQAIGCRRLVAEADELLRVTGGAGDAPAVAVRVLGVFGVAVDGVAVAANAWQSRKARDLFKLLVVRRGRPVMRDRLVDLLWPGESPDAIGNRLNVALSTARGVLDPGREHPTDRWIVTEQDAVWLTTDAVDVDVERFLADAAEGLRLHRTGRDRDAAVLLRRAETTYVGDVLEEDAYSEWTVPLREEARATYLDVVGVLARLEAAAGRPDDAVRYLLRLIERDPFDERAHLQLVRTLDDAGRHGEARRRYVTYDRAMRELGVEPAPFPR